MAQFEPNEADHMTCSCVEKISYSLSYPLSGLQAREVLSDDQVRLEPLSKERDLEVLCLTRMTIVDKECCLYQNRDQGMLQKLPPAR